MPSQKDVFFFPVHNGLTHVCSCLFVLGLFLLFFLFTLLRLNLVLSVIIYPCVHTDPFFHVTRCPVPAFLSRGVCTINFTFFGRNKIRRK